MNKITDAERNILMEYTLYQLPREHGNLYMNHKWAIAHGGINISEYNAVYTGEIPTQDTVDETLEAIFALHNTRRPEGYHDRSMSVSDLVKLEGAGTYFCDSFGFKKLEVDG